MDEEVVTTLDPLSTVGTVSMADQITKDDVKAHTTTPLFHVTSFYLDQRQTYDLLVSSYGNYFVMSSHIFV